MIKFHKINIIKFYYIFFYNNLFYIYIYKNINKKNLSLVRKKKFSYQG